MLLYNGPRMRSLNQSLELPSSGCPRNGCILFLLLKLKKKKKKSLYDLEKLSIARTNSYQGRTVTQV